MDPVSDMFIRIKNAQRAHHEVVILPYSKFKHDIARVLERAGLVKKIEKKGKRAKKTLEIGLGYGKDRPLITEVRMFSKPSRKLYVPYRELRAPERGGVIVISTPKGVMNSNDARKEKVGGLLIAEVW